MALNFHEVPSESGSIEVEIGDRKLACLVCGSVHFHERNSLLNTRTATFFKLDWANDEARNYICVECGYVFWFLRP